MTRTVRTLLLASITLATVAGCSSEDGSSPDDVGAPDADVVADADVDTADVAAPDGDTADTVDVASDSDAEDTGVDSGGDPDVEPVDTDIDTQADIDIGPICGNGELEGGEICDDGNNFPGDGCSPTCLSDESCGNSIVDPTESCDDGNITAGDGCDEVCRVEVGCGNGVVDPGEHCDDGNAINGDGCSSTCQREIVIADDADGDGIADIDEGGGTVDTDDDGTTDDLDLDSDDDGIPDAVEAGDTDLDSFPFDTDDDGVPDYRDLDSDSDAIPDAVEGAGDPDDDGFGNFADTDSDGDYIPDITETTRDSDGDSTPDYVDIDSDNDTILDEHELFADSDIDGVPNRLDADSDDDGIPDSDEAGDDELATYPVDSDGDGRPDYIDLDSDGDGLPDGTEGGCADDGPERLDPDSDDDGFSDLAEVLVGSDPCAETSDEAFAEFTDFFFILPSGADPEEAPLEFSSNIVQADISLAMDTTASMGGEMANLRDAFSSSIVPTISELIPNAAFGSTTFDDFLCDGHGLGVDQPFILRQRITLDETRVQAAIAALPLHSGGDHPESGYESMYQTATGLGVSGCGASVPAFDMERQYVEGVADGPLGGVGFRVGSFPIVVHVTDAPSHDEDAYGTFAASRDEAVAALRNGQIRFIGVASGPLPRDQLEYVAQQTGGRVPPCAWDGDRPDGCADDECCTAMDGAGVPTDGGGACPLVFDIDESGAGLGSAAITAIQALANTTRFEVTTDLRRDEEEFEATGVDTSCFIQSIVPDHFEMPAGSCASTPTIADINPTDGIDDSYTSVTPGTALFFLVTADNADCVEQTDLPQAFTAHIDVRGDGVTVLDTMRVTIIVPAESLNPSTVP